MLLLPDHPKANSRGYVQEHRVIAEKAMMGDENPHNNEKGNLVVCQDKDYHQLLHKRARAFRATGNPHARYCSDCCSWLLSGDFPSQKGGVCSACNIKRSHSYYTINAERLKREKRGKYALQRGGK